MSSQLSNLLIDVKGLISNGNVNYRDYSFKLVNIVPENYTYGLNAKEFYDDLVKLNELTSKNFNGRFFNRGNDLIMKIYLKNKEVKLSNIVRILDNLTFNVRDHSGFEIVDESVKMSIHEFKASSALDVDLINNHEASQSFFETFEKILNDEWNESLFNKFSLTVGLNFREIQLLTALKSYYRQVAPKYDIETISILTQKHVDVFQLFVKLFHLKFNPDMKAFIKLDDLKIVRNAINEALNKIDVLDNYKTLKNIYEILLAISRTNYYQNKSYISLKIRPALLSYLTGTQPFAEIFVFSYEFEAVHLRESKVSRGGLRWSDRRDYRTEVLGLMRAQMKKNTIIIPQGAKGGFFINHPERCRADKNYVVNCYKTFLRGILDITDNLDAKNQIIRPPMVILPVDLEPHILKDEVQDPYVVVAADKGTGTFSDYANSVSAEYKFWLDDAYASGGSNGYDHKKLAITSRGAWVTVTKLFNEIGVDITEQDFTVIGIGDMFSDVFGNGMLLSKRIKLVAAFNHMHVFIDPNPNPLSSYDERRRLFKLPYSTWNDYNRELISEGGGIWSRKEKSIAISKQVAELLDIPNTISSLPPDELIRYCLKARADLLWNGGIGTFFKGENESHEDAADKSNDNIRINGGEVRARVVSEGGNLGFTQLSRVELARKGGKINTDFIDNSAGVSCSDREVNIKIVMSSAIRNNRITLEERNQILAEMSDDVCQMVLRDNLHQNYALMLSESYSHEALDKHIDLMLKLESMKILNRKFEKLPSDQQIDKLKQDKLCLTRPELSVLLAYTKIWLKGEILRTKIPDDKFFENYLVHYFPKRMQDQFREEILGHPLRREIITNFITNLIVNRLGKNFMFSVLDKTGHRIEDVIYGFFVIFSSYKLYSIWHDLEYNHNLEVSAKISALLEIRQFAVSETCSLLRNHDSFDILKMVANLSSDISTIIENFEEYNSATSVHKYNQKVNRFLQLGLKQDLAEKISELSFLKNLPSLVELHKQFNVDLKVVTKLYAMVDERLNVKEIKEIVSNWRCFNLVQETAVQILIDNIADEHLKIVRHILQELVSSDSLSEVDSVAKWADEYEVQLANYTKVSEKIYGGSEPDYSRIILLINRMGALHKLE